MKRKNEYIHGDPSSDTLTCPRKAGIEPLVGLCLTRVHREQAWTAVHPIGMLDAVAVAMLRSWWQLVNVFFGMREQIAPSREVELS